MSLPITPISAATSIDLPQLSNVNRSAHSFGEAFSSAVQHVEASSANADRAAQDFMRGGTEEIHSTILAAQSAELDFELLMQVRNKVVSAYEEIMKMQV